MADLFLVVDTGGSQTKIIFQSSDADSPECLLMPPEVECISQLQFDRYQERIGWLGSPSPLQQAWLSVNDQLWVVGAFAAEFDPEDRLHEKKYENALYKVMAAIGVIAQTLGLAQRQLSVHLAMLLPWQEFNDRKAFETHLASLLGEFSFRQQKLKVKLKSFLCRPEGGGLAATRMRLKGLEWFQQQRLVVLLFGHRNTSALYFEQGLFKQGDSPLYGFSQMLDLLVARYSVLDKHALLLALVTAMQKAKEKLDSNNRLIANHWNRGNRLHYPLWSNSQAMTALVSVRDDALRKAELTALSQAIEAAFEEYWEKLEAWMERVVPDNLDEVIVSGGAALMLEPKLTHYFSEGNRERPFDGELVWDAELHESMGEAFNWRYQYHADKAHQIARFADAYGLFDQMLSAAGAKA
ncbi:ParM/StbA family protein [Leptothoe sp. PORK10 BA2]|uniref:ParM/StbA family protein n=1 Tax=Leptothoe sp. PORK10 BA2 TaxID=3110254 RepID=UPI002B1F2268|nr:ParM/StbA family protein [Leptothoe sp. PORK10 BA2]MEA5466959.1 ParM/StbA family protein [Leptothoe sp. PORK10 BA2]